MKKMLRAYRCNKEGISALEYAFIAAGIAIAVTLAAQSMGLSVSGFLERIDFGGE